MAQQIIFSGEHQHRVVVTINGYDAEPEAAYSLDVTIAIENDPFSGSMGTYIPINDLHNFYQRLKQSLKTLKGVVLFENIDHDFFLIIHFDARGHATVRCTLRQKHPWKDFAGSLSGEIATDQTYLATTIQQLKRVLEEHSGAYRFLDL